MPIEIRRGFHGLFYGTPRASSLPRHYDVNNRWTFCEGNSLSTNRRIMFSRECQRQYLMGKEHMLQNAKTNMECSLAYAGRILCGLHQSSPEVES